MTLLRELGAELWKMFMADARLTLSILILVGLIAAALRGGLLEPHWAGLSLLIGSIQILLAAVARERRRVQSASARNRS